MITTNELLTELQHSHNALLLIWRDIDARGITDTTAAQNVKQQIERNRIVIAEAQKHTAYSIQHKEAAMNSQQLATRIYTAHVTGLKTMLKRLHTPVSNKFFIDPAKANWSHVNTIESFTKTVRDICDMTFNEGKYADFQPTNHGGFYEARL